VQGKPLTFSTDIYSAGVLVVPIADGTHSKRRGPTGLDKPLDAILHKALRENRKRALRVGGGRWTPIWRLSGRRARCGHDVRGS